ncbi:efflux RND transporter permease subunit [Aureimonas populi]|uniref:Efflux RND transporter permease subunit n=1 Tax=Aureimonas populi TaxID=1701758 RepID=A0ABW5CMH4_9HYPH|nr:efflux RND transporter permease subunit [Aureimonas populi]
MTLPELSLKRPVFITVLNLLIVLIGVVALTRLPVRELPQIISAEVTVTVAYTGASPEVIDAQISSVVEGALAGITGLRSMMSETERGSTRTVLTFDPGIDIDFAANDVRSAIDTIVAELPDDADPPVVEKNNSQAEPVLRLSLSSTSMTPMELTDWASRNLTERLSRLPGVARASIFGARDPAMRIWLDTSAMAEHSVTAQDVISALGSWNLELPTGDIETGARQIQLLARTRLGTPEEFSEIVVRDQGARPFLLGDVARVEVAPEATESNFRTNGVSGLGIGIQAQAQANTVLISEAVRAEVNRIVPNLPDGMTLEITSDEAVFIESTIAEVLRVFVEAIVLVMVVIFLFLGSVRLSLVPVVTIPISLLGAAISMLILGFSINILTLFALILAIGIVVDDAIIVLENIQRHKREGVTTIEAVRRGTNQVNFAVIAITAVLAAVFLPVSFMEGEIGQLFAEFGIVLTVAVLVSGFVALTLSPVLASLVMRDDERANLLTRTSERVLGALERTYRAILSRLLHAPVALLALTGFVMGMAWVVYGQLPQQLIPNEDRGQFRIYLAAPQGTSLERTDVITAQVEAILDPLRRTRSPEGVIESVSTIVGHTGDIRRAQIEVNLVPWNERSVTVEDVLAELGPQLDAVTDAMLMTRVTGGLGGGAEDGLQWMLGGPDVETAAEWAEELAELLEETGRFEEVEIDYAVNQPAAMITIDRARAQDLDVDAHAVTQTLQVLFASHSVGEYARDGRQYPVILQAAAGDRASLAALDRVQIRNERGDLIPLSSFVSVETGAAVPEIIRFDRAHSVEMEADLGEDADLGAAIAAVESAARELPAGATIAWQGQADDYLRASSGIVMVFALGLVIVYLVLAAQFESFTTPLTILLTVPLGLAGAVGTLFLAGASINIYSQVGLVLLVGLLAKNGILIVEFANQLREEGRSLYDAALEGAVTRLRPVIMTTITMVLGALPLALASGPGAESRRAVGLVITGGLSFGLLLTLFLIPVVYVLVERASSRGRRRPNVEHVPAL